MNYLYVFNPGHEEALTVPLTQHYTSPKVVKAMIRDLSPLMQLFAEDGDYIYIPHYITNGAYLTDHLGRTIDDTSRIPPLQLRMWAIEPHLIREIAIWAELKKLTVRLPTISQTYMQLSHRNGSYSLLRNLCLTFPQHFPNEYILPYWLYPQKQIYTSAELNNIATQLTQYSWKGELIAKRPFTSSGRGVYSLTTPLSETSAQLLIKHGKKHGISLEPKLQRQQDYALLLVVTEHSVQKLGYSKFATDSQRGLSYSGNILISQEAIEAELIDALGSTLEDWQAIEHYITAYLRERLVGEYVGYIGIDMFSYFDENGRLQLHPTVEINLRCTMGVIAYQLMHRYLCNSSEGIYRLEAFPSTQSLLDFDHSMQTQHPIILDEKGKTIQGYMRLNSLHDNCLFLAYILVGSNIADN